ncbi:MAG TPA: fasciclin domain-containing protein [Kofleriaceae bacterium]|nr:fasciclin domain-containing protein [Kofleriaceae bacterium]
MSKLTHFVSTALLITSMLAACGDDDAAAPAPDAPGPAAMSITAVAQATPSLATLVATVQFASENNDLVDLLASPGTLTVFAPTNAAFDALAVELSGSATAKGADLLTAANKPLLRSVLKYHVLTTEVRAAQIPFGHPITASDGNVLEIKAGTPPTILDGRNRTANITATDIAASNGVVHVIDKVILPPDKTIVQTAQALAAANPAQFTVLVDAVVAADLAGTLSGAGPFTVFAPTDAAFAALLAELNLTKAQLLANKALLVKVLTYHVVAGRVFAADVPVGTPITTVETEKLTVDASLTITDARGRKSKIVTTDVQAANGVIHVVDKVLLPAP